MPQPILEVEHIPKEAADALDRHKKTIAVCIKGHRTGSAQMFGYAYLAGREILAVREVLPHGNTGNRSLGICKWLAAHFPTLPRRTATRFMEFADDVHANQRARAIFAKNPDLLTTGKLTVKDRAAILEIIPLVLDGKSMKQFMRDSRLLADPLKNQHHPRKKLDKQKALADKKKQAERFWDRIFSDHALGQPLLRLYPREKLQAGLDACVETTTAIRALLKSERSTPIGRESNEAMQSRSN